MRCTCTISLDMIAVQPTYIYCTHMVRRSTSQSTGKVPGVRRTEVPKHYTELCERKTDLSLDCFTAHPLTVSFFELVHVIQPGQCSSVCDACLSYAALKHRQPLRGLGHSNGLMLCAVVGAKYGAM